MRSERPGTSAFGVRVLRGLPDPLRAPAARLYWDAFGAKLGRVMGPEPLALTFLERVIRADHCIHALDEGGGLAGIAGFKSPLGGFASGTPADLAAVYGRRGAIWRNTLLRMLQSEVDNDRFLVDGICVARALRGRGIGSALIEALAEEGRSRGYSAIRLDVVDSNTRARALYERLGFEPLRSERLGALRHVFGFASATSMVRPL